MQLCRPFGRIQNLDVAAHNFGPRRGMPKGFAFVEYATRKEAEAAREALNNRPLLGQPLTVRFVTERMLFRKGEDTPLDPNDLTQDQSKQDREYRTESERRLDAQAALEASRRQAKERKRTRYRLLVDRIHAIREKLIEIDDRKKRQKAKHDEASSKTAVESWNPAADKEEEAR